MPRFRVAARHGSPRWVLVATLTGVFATSFPIVILAASLARRPPSPRVTCPLALRP